MGAAAALAAVFRRLGLSEMVLWSCERPFSVSARVSPTVLGEHSTVLLPPALTTCLRTAPSDPVSSAMTRHFILFSRFAVTGIAHTPQV